MRSYEAPAKLNLALHVEPPRDGYHPLTSLVQTIEWCDVLEVEPSEEMLFSVNGAELDPDDNLVVEAFRRVSIDRVRLVLDKQIPLGSGLGGGSSDGAAALVAAVDHGRLDRGLIDQIAPELGSDVPLFVRGGTQMMTGRGEKLTTMSALAGFAVAVVVPDFELSTAEVYGRWDELEGPEAQPLTDDDLPPGLRDSIPIRNDLLPAALAIEPRLGDFMADVRAAWGSPTLLTGSGSACYGFFASLSEARDAATAVVGTRAAAGAMLRDRGVAETQTQSR